MRRYGPFMLVLWFCSTAAFGQAVARRAENVHEQWALKVGDDRAARSVSLHAQPITVVELARLPSVESARRTGTAEHTVYRIDADILRWRLERDGDVHLVIRDHGQFRGPTMIAEVPDPQFVLDSSPWKSQIARVRRTVDRSLRPEHRFLRRVVHVQVSGVGFFDHEHGQSGAAVNQIELHPVLGLRILSSISLPSVLVGVHRQTGNPTQNGSASPNDPTVWVNTRTGIYHYPGTRSYGRTREGEYLRESIAIKDGFRAARNGQT